MPPVHPTFCAVAKLTAICQRGMTHVDRKDEIIQLQMDVISQMTQSNLRRIADDLWSGETGNPASAIPQPETAAPKREEEQPPPAETLDDLRRELEGYIGLAAVKREVESLINPCRNCARKTVFPCAICRCIWCFRATRVPAKR